MKCQMQCTKRAKLKVSTSSGNVQCLCFKHSFMLIKQLIRSLGRYNFGVYVQSVVDEHPVHEIAPEARHRVFTPDDRAKRESAGEEGWDF